MTSALRTGGLSVALLLAGGGGLAVATDGFQAFTTETARRLAVRRQPVDLPAAALQDQSGVQFSLADRQGTWLLVDFIYTRCQTLCTVLGGDFTQLAHRLAAPIARGEVRLLSLSFDPAHDSPADLAAYLARHRGRPPDWQAARPMTEAGLRQLTEAFGVTVIPDGFGGWTHNPAIHLVDPAGRLVDIFDVAQVDQVEAALLRRLAP